MATPPQRDCTYGPQDYNIQSNALCIKRARNIPSYWSCHAELLEFVSGEHVTAMEPAATAAS